MILSSGKQIVYIDYTDEKGGGFMNKADLSALVAQQTGYSKRLVGKVIRTAFDSIESALSKGEKVVIRDFGTFQAAIHKERNRINPYTGKHYIAPAKKYPSFRAGKTLKRAVDKG